MCWVQVTPGVTLSNVTPLNIFLLDANFDKSTLRLHYLRIFFMLARFVKIHIQLRNIEWCNA